MMKNARKSRGASMAGLAFVLGCGARSSMGFDDLEKVAPGGAGGTIGAGGTTNQFSGGMPAVGGWYASGGSGGTNYPVSPQACCSSSAAPSCNDYWIVQCVCSSMPFCCTGIWNSGCVAAVSAYGCGVCPTGSGGVASYGGTTSRGGTTSAGGSTSRGGVPATGGTNVYAGGSSTGGAPAKQACCSVHPSLGCADSTVEKCVCSRDAVCCSAGWDSVCVQQLTDFGCGSCGAGGTTGSGGSVGTGGASTAGGGVIARGGGPAAGGAITTGGASATGGATAIGGAFATGGTTAVPQYMIDDLEDGDGDIIRTESRGGYWYTFNDGTPSGWQLPEWAGRIFNAQSIGDRPGSKFAAWTQGGGFTDWGAGMALYFRGSSSFYNANKYRGITFWARVSPNCANVIRVNVSDDQTVSDGGYCTNCWDHFGVTLIVSTDWNRYGFSWSDMTQRNWGIPQADKINPAKLRGIEFSTQQGIPFDLYVDDIAFMP